MLVLFNLVSKQVKLHIGHCLMQFMWRIISSLEQLSKNTMMAIHLETVKMEVPDIGNNILGGVLL